MWDKFHKNNFLKLWAMLHDIELAWHEIITNLMVESESKILIDMVNQEIRDDRNFPTLISRIRRMTQRNLNIKLNHT